MASPLKLIRGFNNTGLIYYPTGYNGKLYFTAHSYSDERGAIFNGDEKQFSAVWVTDGSTEGTKSLYDFALGEPTFVPTQPFNTANNRLFFQIRIDGEEGAGSSRTELWSYLDVDPSTNKEKLIKIANSLPNTYSDHRFDDKTEAINSGLFFFQRPKVGEDELWFTNGETGTSNTYSLGGSKQHPRAEFVWLEGADNLLYFIADGEENVDGRKEPRWDPNELWVTSSTPGTFQKISDFDYQPLWNVSSPIDYETTIGDSLFFKGARKSSGDNEIGPWISDGGALVKPFRGLTYQLGNDWSVPEFDANHFTHFNGEIYFLSRTGTDRPYSESLYAYNIKTEETRFVAQTSDEWANFNRELFVFNDLMYFSGHTEDTGWELWVTDGTNSGTGLVKDLSYRENDGAIVDSGSYHTHPQGFAIHKKDRTRYTSLDDDLYFRDDADQLWKIEAGTSSPTQVELPNINSGVSEITSVDLSHGGSDLYFTMGTSIYTLDAELEPKPVNRRGTIGDETFHGGDGNDELVGLRGRDYLYGYKGNDILRAGNGRDTINGGEGKDELYGGFGHNTFENEQDGSIDKLFFKSDQFAYNYIYDQAGNNPNGRKVDIIKGLDAFDEIIMQGVVTSQLTFAAVENFITPSGQISGIGIFADGFIECIFTGNNLNINQVSSMTSGIPA